MRICIRFIVYCVLGMLIWFSAAVHCSAESADPLAPLYDSITEMELPQEAVSGLEEAGISADHPESAADLSPDSVLHHLLRTAAEEAAAPLKLCGTLLTVTVLCALLGSMSDTASDASVRRVFEMLCAALCIASAVRPLCACLIRTAEALETGRIFMGSYVPVFSGFLAAGGSVSASAAYQVFVLFLTEGIMQITGAVLFPLTQMAAALGIADAVNPKLQLGSMISGFRSAVTWTLGFIMTMFSAMLSIRSIVASAADSLAAKSVRFITSGAVPIVGSAVADAFGTVQGSILLLRNGVGAVGILVILWLVLPPMLSLLLYRAAFRIALMLAEPAGAACMAQLCRNAQHVLSAAFAMLVCFGVMLIISTAVMLLLTGAAS